MFYRLADPSGRGDSIYTLVAAGIAALRARVRVLDRRRRRLSDSSLNAYRRKTDEVRGRVGGLGGFRQIEPH